MSSLTLLDPSQIEFPSSELALDEPNGLLAVGGDLSSERLINAYQRGIFPWYEEPQPILWWSPSPRAVLEPSSITISRSLLKRLKRKEYQVHCDRQFKQVITHCMNVPRHDQDGTWINPTMIEAYCKLHEMGIAHSIETWHNDELIGGLYGIALGKVFFGESMFSLRTDASKVALAHLCRQLERWGFTMIDCQVSNPHLLSLGAKEIPRNVFEDRLCHNVNKKTELDTSTTWENQWQLKDYF